MALIKKYSWPIIIGSIIIIGFLLRLLWLDQKTLHHDESIHAYYSWILFKDWKYEYHPLSHGPVLYYFMALCFKLFGVSDATARLAPALFGTGLIALFLMLKSHMKKQTVIILMILVATSPMLVYVSRFARHDMISLFCTALIIFSTIKYLSSPKSIYVYLTVLSFALSYANHELTYITFVVWAFALFFTVIFMPNKRKLWNYFKNRDIWHFGLALVFAIVIICLFFSSFGTFMEGIRRALPNLNDPDSALGYWKIQQEVKRGGQPWYFYFLTLPLYDIIPFILGSIGILIGMFQKNFAWKFTAIFAALTLFFYSFAGEKMPWLTIHSLLPLIIVSGFLIDRFWPINNKLQIPILVTMVFLFSITLVNMYRLCYLMPDNPKELAVYVQTQPIVKQLSQKLEKYGKPVTLGTDLTWPYVWYLRDTQYNLTTSTSAPSDDFALYSLDEVNAIDESQLDNFNKSTVYPFRSWWVPDVGWPGMGKFLNYYFLRVPWNKTGSYDFKYFEK